MFPASTAGRQPFIRRDLKLLVGIDWDYVSWNVIGGDGNPINWSPIVSAELDIRVMATDPVALATVTLASSASGILVLDTTGATGNVFPTISAAAIAALPLGVPLAWGIRGIDSGGAKVAIAEGRARVHAFPVH